ncbi:MAG: UDP-N-acetylglucosamine 2-epimerase [Panacagrimonas sp.]
MRQLLQARPELSCVWCLHPNPAVADTVRAVFDNLAEAVTERLALVAPLAYPDMLAVMRDADVLLSDSGGIQEESVSLRLPVLIARQDTERPEVVDCGAGRLVGTATDRVLQAVNQLLDSATHYEAMTGEVQNPFGDGRAGQSIAEALLGTA